MRGSRSVDAQNVLQFHPDKKVRSVRSFEITEEAYWRVAARALVLGVDVSQVIQSLIDEHVPAYDISLKQTPLGDSLLDD